MAHFSYHSEENYLKMLYKLSGTARKVNNIALAKALELNPATVLEMVRKLVSRGLLELQQDKSIKLTEKGKKRALLTIRKHRIWEVFLVDKLNYAWNEVHELAEQLEHIDSPNLIDRLETFLGNPAFDPHGDPIPDRSGKIRPNPATPLSTVLKGKTYEVVSLAETNDSFLSYLDKIQLKPGTKFKFTEINEYDGSITITLQKKPTQLSQKVAENILVKPVANKK